MKTLVTIVATTLFSLNLFALDLTCRGQIETPKSSGASLDLKISERLIGTAVSSEEVFSVTGRYTHVRQPEVVIVDGRVEFALTGTLLVNDLNIGIMNKELVGNDPSGNFETYKFRGLINSNKKDYLEVNRSKQTARLFVSSPLSGYKVVECKTTWL